MLKLIQNEWMKLWAVKSTWIMLILAVLIAIVPFITDQLTNNDNYSENNNTDWNAYYKDQISYYEEELKYNTSNEQYYKDEIAKFEYRIENNIRPDYSQTTESYFKYGADLLNFLSIFAVIVGASIVSSEMATGTIKMLLTRPVSRAKILTSKLLTTFIYGLFIYGVVLVVTYLIGLLFYDPTTDIALIVKDGEVFETSQILLIMKESVYYLGQFILSILFAFMIGSVFRSSSLAIGLTLGITFMGSIVVVFLSKYEIVKYIWLTHLDLSQHLHGSVFIEGITLTMSLIVLAVYAVIFTAISYFVFMKRDIVA